MKSLQQYKFYNKRQINICIPLMIYVFRRYTGLMAAGTQLFGTSRQSLALILTYHNIWLRNMQTFDNKNVDLQMIFFIQQKYMINPKYLQHFFSVAYPKHLFSLTELNTCYPEIKVIDPKSSIYVSFDVVFPTIVTQALKNDPLFREGKISVLGFPKEEKSNKILNSLEYQHTGQPNPDYWYEYNTKTNIWQRFYDLKTGHIAANKGHIFCVREGKQYEEWSENILNAQKTCYKKNPLVFKKLTELIQNKNLTWGERNDLFHIFLKQNMSKFPEINPSLIIKSNLLYEIDNTKPQKSILEIVNLAGPCCLESYEKSVDILAQSIYAGGRNCIQTYSQIKSANPKIVQILKQMTLESVDYLLNNS